METQTYYVLLSGRWYQGHSIGKQWEWEHVPNDALPKALAEIPRDSVNASVLPMVGGTPEAKDAMLDNTIPQTAAVKREGGDPLGIQYDGAPQWEKIEGIPATYAINTPSAVFEVGGPLLGVREGHLVRRHLAERPLEGSRPRSRRSSTRSRPRTRTTTWST